MNAVPVHVPVLLREVLTHLPLPPAARVLDLTLGLGGHAEALLARCDEASRYLGVDRDPAAREAAAARLGGDARLTILPGTYETLWESEPYLVWTCAHAPQGFDVVLMDLGVSTLQLRSPERGFSFQADGPLDMRMDPGEGPTALAWIAAQDERSLAEALASYGEERAARPIARRILKSLAEQRLQTTRDLASAVYAVLPRQAAKSKGQIDPATRTFQAIRIAVNGELQGLEGAIECAVDALKPGGRIGIISFHSLEDRIVKQVLRRLAGTYAGPGRMAPVELPRLVRLVHPGGLVPCDEETSANPPSRSARLRLAERLPGCR